MPRTIMNRATVFSVIISIFSAILFLVFQKKIYLTLAITFGVTAYHLLIRLIVGWLYNISSWEIMRMLQKAGIRFTHGKKNCMIF